MRSRSWVFAGPSPLGIVGRMRSAILKTALSALVVVLLGSVPAQAASKPDTFPLPNGFQPEGIEIGPGPHAYFGSRATGDIYRADLRTGKGSVISKGPGTPSLGLKTDGRRLFVAGGNAGNARVVDLRTGRVLKSYQFATGTSFVNDVVLVGRAAYFTDSSNAVLYKLRLGRGGALPDGFDTIPLTGAIAYGTGINANGIAPSPDRRSLLIVQSNTGKLFEVNPSSGVTTEVNLGGDSLVNGDGLLLSGRTLYAVLNRDNTIAVVGLSRDGSSGKIGKRLTHPEFDIPTTVAAHGHRLYLPNARFSTTPTPDTPYDVVAVKR